MISISPLLRHLAAAQESLAQVKAAAGPGPAVDALEANFARLGAELVERETHLHYQRELNPQLQWIADAAGSVVAMAGHWERWTGLPPEAALGVGWRAIVHPEDLPRYDETARRSMHCRTGYDISFRGRTADGDWRWLRARAAVRTGEDGRLLFVYGYTEDVHDQVLAQQALRESEENLRYTIELNPQLPFRTDPHGNVVEVSSKWMRLIGSDLDGLLGLGSIDFVHPDDADGVRQAWKQSIEARQPHDARYRMRHADGSYRWFRSQAAPRFAADGSIIAWYGVAEDIHEQVLGEEEIAEAAMRYRLAARATNDVIYEWDLTSGEIQWNEAIASLAGSDAGGIGWWTERVHPADRDAVERSLERFFEEGGDDWRGEYRFRRIDGTWSHIYDRAHLLRAADGTPKRLIGAMADLTERDEAEKKVHNLRSELIQASRLSAMGAMAATLAHELNQPLLAAHNWLTAGRAMLEKVPDVPAEAMEALGEGRATILRAGEIIRRIRKLVAGGGVTRADEQLDAVVEEAVTLLKGAELEAKVIFEAEVPAVRVSVDRVQIQQVLLNLMRNSLEAMRDSAERRISIAAQLNGKSAEIVVSDTGSGLEDGVAEELFTPFRTTKATGLGVGLSISRTIVEAHGGRIWLDSDPGRGTAVHFTVPLAAAALRDEEPEQAEGAGARLREEGAHAA